MMFACLPSCRQGIVSPGLTEDELWRAKYIFDSAFHPDTGEKMILIGRMSAQVPMNMTITGCMMTFYKWELGLTLYLTDPNSKHIHLWLLLLLFLWLPLTLLLLQCHPEGQNTTFRKNIKTYHKTQKHFTKRCVLSLKGHHNYHY